MYFSLITVWFLYSRKAYSCYWQWKLQIIPYLQEFLYNLLNIKKKEKKVLKSYNCYLGGDLQIICLPVFVNHIQRLILQKNNLWLFSTHCFCMMTLATSGAKYSGVIPSPVNWSCGVLQEPKSVNFRTNVPSWLVSTHMFSAGSKENSQW